MNDSAQKKRQYAKFQTSTDLLKSSLLFATLLAAILLASACSPSASGASGSEWKTSPIARGTIEQTVSSTGTLKAVGTVSVLAQVTGTLDTVAVDFNDSVRKGQLLARVNTDKLAIALKEANAALEKARAQHEFNELEYTQNKKLFEQKLISESELASYKLAWLSSRASLIQAEAAEETARLNIEEYATVLSPVDGIVLDRAVQAGQTVVGSGNTNTELFTLAESLEAMEIEVLVDELDISSIQEGMAVRFTVEAWGERQYEGRVTQIRKLPTTSNNVVSYTVIVSTSNTDESLLPGMTATADFIVTSKEDVVMVPSAALRFTPSEEIVAAARRELFVARLDEQGLDTTARKAAIAEYDAAQIATKTAAEQAKTTNGATNSTGSSLLGGGMPMPGMMPPPGGTRQLSGGSRTGTSSRGAGTSGTATAAAGRRPIWTLEDDGSLALHMVKTGASDAVNTELIDAEDLLGKKVITRANISKE